MKFKLRRSSFIKKKLNNMKKIILLLTFLFLSITLLDSCSSQKDAAYEVETVIEIVDEDGVIDIIDEEPIYSEYEYEYTSNDLNSLGLPNERKGEISIEEQIAAIDNEIVIMLEPIAREMALGTLVYDMDTAFYYGVISRIVAKISSNYYVEIIPEIITEFNPEEEDIEKYGERLEMNNITTSEVMDMKLNEITPNTFTITPLSSKDQTVEEGWTTWEWSVMPLKPGKYNLRLRAIVKDEHEHSSDIVVFDKEIDVQVQNKASWYLELFNNSIKLLQGYWFILTVLIIPLFVWIHKKYKKKD